MPRGKKTTGRITGSPSSRLERAADLYVRGATVEDAMKGAGYAARTAASRRVWSSGGALRFLDHPVVRERLRRWSGQVDSDADLEPLPRGAPRRSRFELIADQWIVADEQRELAERLREEGSVRALAAAAQALSAASQTLMRVAQLEGWLIERRQEVPLTIDALTVEQKRSLLESARRALTGEIEGRAVEAKETVDPAEIAAAALANGAAADRSEAAWAAQAAE